MHGASSAVGSSQEVWVQPKGKRQDQRRVPPSPDGHHPQAALPCQDWCVATSDFRGAGECGPCARRIGNLLRIRLPFPTEGKQRRAGAATAGLSSTARHCFSLCSPSGTPGKHPGHPPCRKQVHGAGAGQTAGDTGVTPGSQHKRAPHHSSPQPSPDCGRVWKRQPQGQSGVGVGSSPGSPLQRTL